MLQTLRNRRNRKGFTLAELLIVVAIIAVLVAIAVPLFVGALNDAEERVKDANVRSVRAAAVAEILLNYETKSYALDTTSKKEIGWQATANVTSDGSVEGLAITKVAAAVDSKCDDYKGTDGKYKYTVTVYITELKTA